MLEKAVEEYLAAHRQQFLARLCRLLRFPSIANAEPPQGGACRQAAEWLAKTLEDLQMQAELLPTAGPPCVLARRRTGDDRPTVLIYGHYDVQPAEPLDLWKTDPFEPTITDEAIIARGASDDKGQLFAHIMAIEAWEKAGGGVPLNVTLLLEGEEEIGSPNLESLILQYGEKLSADAAVISDGGFFADELPSIIYALRGLIYMEITLTAAKQDLHSGQYGGAAANPINALARMVAKMHDENGRVTIPGFYDEVSTLSPTEKDEWSKLPFDEAAFAADVGLGSLAGGEKGLSVLERLWARPTLDCNGIVGGYIGPGSKTIIPAKASVKISTRLVPHQDPKKIVEGFRKFLDAHTPPEMHSELTVFATVKPVLVSRESAVMDAARTAYRYGFGREPIFIRCGATVPVTELLQRLLGLDAVLMPFGLPEDNLHGPNERFLLRQLWRAAATSALFLQEMARQGRR